MGGDHELAPGEYLREAAKYLRLPNGMQVKVDLVYQYATFARQGVGRTAVGHRQHARYVAHQCEIAFFAIRQLVDAELVAVLVHQEIAWAAAHTEMAIVGRDLLTLNLLLFL